MIDFTQAGSRRRPGGALDGHSDGGSDGGDAERGAVTAEYAILALAAVGFAGLLVVLLRSGEVRELLLGVIRSALQIPG